MDIIAILAIGSFALMVPVALTAYPIWYLLHKPLTIKLDPLLFKEPYFKRSELTSCQFFPYSAIKTAIYMYLIAAPTLAKKKRFRGLQVELPVSTGIRWASRVWVFSSMLGGAACIIILTSSVYFFFII